MQKKVQRKAYDLAFGLGTACSCSETLRTGKLQYLSFPYDWVAPISEDEEGRNRDFVRRAQEIADEFSTWFGHDDFTYVKPLPQFGKDVYHCTRLGLIFNHDFLLGSSYEEMFPQVAAKYRRRCDRLVALIRASRRVLVLHVDRPDLPGVLSTDAAREGLSILQKKFPQTRFDLLLLSREKGRSVTDCRLEEIAPGITRTTFDYKDYTPGTGSHQIDHHMTGGFLAARVTVRDYRTAAEKRHFKDAKWAHRCKTSGVSSRTEYYRVQVQKYLNGPLNVFGNLRARLRRRNFEQIAILGFNCETAFRFVRKWDFLDSSLFAWASTEDLSNLIHALTVFDRICAGEMRFEPVSRMWLCTESNVHFHGRMRARKGDTAPSQEALDKDLADLRGRIGHLKEKFLAYIRSDKPTLLVYKLNPKDAVRPDLGSLFGALESELQKLGAKNCTLLTVCERKHLAKMPPETAARLFRAVSRYNPIDDTTNIHLGDAGGWNRIYSEFAPLHVLKRAHAFKYE